MTPAHGILHRRFSGKQRALRVSDVPVPSKVTAVTCYTTLSAAVPMAVDWEDGGDRVSESGLPLAMQGQFSL